MRYGICLAVFIVAYWLLMTLVWQPVRADGECLLMARTVEILEATPAEQQKAQRAQWLDMTADNAEAQRAIMSAVNWFEAGQTSAEAWKACESI